MHDRGSRPTGQVRRQASSYETWWVAHLYVYLGLALAFAHQIFTGVSFIGHPLVRMLWVLVWAATAGLVIVFRITQPIWRSLRHRLQVVEVRSEAPGVVSGGLPGDGTWTGWPYRAASSSCGISSPGSCGGRASVLAVRPAAAALHPGHHQGTRRPEQGGRRPAAGYPDRHRRALRRVHRPCAHLRRGRPVRRRGRDHPDPGAAGGPARRRRCGGRGPRVDRCGPGPPGRGGRAGPAAPRPARPDRRLAAQGQARRPGPAADRARHRPP